MSRLITILIIFCFNVTSHGQIYSLIEKRIYGDLTALVPSNWVEYKSSHNGVVFAMMLSDKVATFPDNINLVANQKPDGMSLKDYSSYVAKKFTSSNNGDSSNLPNLENRSDIFMFSYKGDVTVKGKSIQIIGITYFAQHKNEYLQFSYTGRIESYSDQKAIIDQLLKSILEN